MPTGLHSALLGFKLEPIQEYQGAQLREDHRTVLLVVDVAACLPFTSHKRLCVNQPAVIDKAALLFKSMMTPIRSMSKLSLVVN